VFGQPDPFVVIAGNGLAGSALACLLLDRGFGVLFLARRAGLRSSPVIEAFPEATVRLFAEVGLGESLAEAGSVAVAGFDNGYGDRRRMDGWWLHVDRRRLDRACYVATRRRGAAAMPADGSRPAAFAFVDATGRAARWSRPVARAHPCVTALFAGPGAAEAVAGRVVRMGAGWAYRLAHPDGTTVGVTGPAGHGPRLDERVASDLGLADLDRLVPVGRRPASVQWSKDPIGVGRLAVGDAALAYSPLAGQGVRFALASAQAAAAVLSTWRDGDVSLGREYYRSFVDQARRRHLAKIEAIANEGEPAAPPPGINPEAHLAFTAVTCDVPMNVGGRVRRGPACLLPDGGQVRWVGGFDLLSLREAVDQGETVAGTCRALERAAVPGPLALVAWAVRTGVLTCEEAPVTHPGEVAAPLRR
jgi:hypothetical protein